MADLLDGLARWLDAQGLVTYDATGATGCCFIEAVPQAPNECVVLSLYGGDVPDSRLGYDSPQLQVRTRGTADPRTSRAVNAQIRAALHGLGPVSLPDGTLLLSCNASQGAPAPIGLDKSGRHEHVTNYDLEVRAVTEHRV